MSLLRRIKFKTLCNHCKYYEDAGLPNEKCAVFDRLGKHIPQEISTTRFHPKGATPFDHRYPHPEDGGIQFERKTPHQYSYHYKFKHMKAKDIEKEFLDIISDLDKLPRSKSANSGHLPTIWLINDD